MNTNEVLHLLKTNKIIVKTKYDEELEISAIDYNELEVLYLKSNKIEILPNNEDFGDYFDVEKLTLIEIL